MLKTIFCFTTTKVDIYGFLLFIISYVIMCIFIYTLTEKVIITISDLRNCIISFICVTLTFLFAIRPINMVLNVSDETIHIENIEYSDNFLNASKTSMIIVYRDENGNSKSVEYNVNCNIIDKFMMDDFKDKDIVIHTVKYYSSILHLLEGEKISFISSEKEICIYFWGLTGDKKIGLDLFSSSSSL